MVAVEFSRSTIMCFLVSSLSFREPFIIAEGLVAPAELKERRALLRVFFFSHLFRVLRDSLTAGNSCTLCFSFCHGHIVSRSERALLYNPPCFFSLPFLSHKSCLRTVDCTVWIKEGSREEVLLPYCISKVLFLFFFFGSMIYHPTRASPYHRLCSFCTVSLHLLLACCIRCPRQNDGEPLSPRW